MKILTIRLDSDPPPGTAVMDAPEFAGAGGASARDEGDTPAPREDPDRELVERAQSELPYGTSAFNEIVRRHSSRVYGRSYGILRSTACSSDPV